MSIRNLAILIGSGEKFTPRDLMETIKSVDGGEIYGLTSDYCDRINGLLEQHGLDMDKELSTASTEGRRLADLFEKFTDDWVF